MNPRHFTARERRAPICVRERSLPAWRMLSAVVLWSALLTLAVPAFGASPKADGDVLEATLAGEYALQAGRLDEATAERHRSVLELVGLPTGYRGAEWPQLLEAMKLDKKTRGDQLRFVVLDGLARPSILTAPDPALLTAAYAEVSAPTSGQPTGQSAGSAPIDLGGPHG